MNFGLSETTELMARVATKLKLDFYSFLRKETAVCRTESLVSQICQLHVTLWYGLISRDKTW